MQKLSNEELNRVSGGKIDKWEPDEQRPGKNKRVPGQDQSDDRVIHHPEGDSPP